MEEHVGEQLKQMQKLGYLLQQLVDLYGAVNALPSSRRCLHLRVRRSFWSTTAPLKEEEFRVAFRMKRDYFRNLVDLLRPFIQRDVSMGSLRNGAVEPEVRVAIVLHILAGASDIDLMMLWQVARPTIYQVFHETSEAILKSLPFDDFPRTIPECSFLSHVFHVSRRRNNPLPGCIGALDGIAIRITKPRASDCFDPASYFHRKGFYALPVQAICDSRYRFTFFSAKCAGPTHDSVAFSVSSYANKLRNGLLPYGYWIAADDAYICDENIITPISSANTSVDTPAEAFNFFLSSHRMHIEQAFGIMRARWGILWRPLRFSLSQNSRVVQLAMCLHNYCIDRKDDALANLMTSTEYENIQTYSMPSSTRQRIMMDVQKDSRVAESGKIDQICVVDCFV